MMLWHLFNNIRVVLLLVLTTAISFVHLTDYGVLFNVVPSTIDDQALPKSMGVIDHYLQQYSYSKYKNIVDDNIFTGATNPGEARAMTVVTHIDHDAMQLEIRGLAETPEGNLVLVWDKEARTSHVLMQNDSINHWQILTVDTQKVVLMNEAGELHEVILNEELLKEAEISR